MKKRGISIALFILAAAMLAAMLSACSTSPNEEQLREKGNVCVTFNANGGTLGGFSERKCFIMPNPGYVPEPGSAKAGNNIPAAVRTGFEFDGWWLEERDGDGNLLFNTKWDFNSDTTQGDIVLYAKWNEYYTFNILYGYNNSQVLSNKASKFIRPTIAPTWAGHTLLGYFLDEQCKIAVPDNYAPESHDLDVNIYTKWLDGVYTLVSKPSDLDSIGVATNFYLLNDIDFAGYTWKFKPTYSGIFEGNGYTISNINISNVTLSDNITRYGLFGDLVGAQINNVTFEDCNIGIQIGGRLQSFAFGFLGGRANAETTITNVNIYGSTASVRVDPAISGIPIEAGKMVGRDDGAAISGDYEDGLITNVIYL